MRRWWVRAVLVCVAVLIGVTTAVAAGPAAPGAPVLASVAQDVDADEGVVLAGGIDDLFVVSKAMPMPLRAPHDGASWARFRLTADWSQARGPVVRVVNTAGQTVTVYVPRLNLRLQRSRLDAEQAPGYSGVALNFELPAGLRAGDVVYVRAIRSGANSQLYFTDVDTAHELDLSSMRWILFTTTVLGVVFIANLSFILIERRAIFMHFGGMTGGAYLYYAYLYGEGYRLPVLRLARELGTLAWSLPATVALACALCFLAQLMHLRVYAPHMERVMRFVVYGMGGCFVTLVVAPESTYTVLYQAANVLALIAVISIVVATVIATLRGSRAARFVLFAWMPMVIIAGLSAAQFLFGLWSDISFAASYLGTTALAGITLALALADQTWHRQRELDAARHAAQTDALSGALNRRALETRLAAAFEDARRHHEPMSLLFLDLDHFKDINDRYGHAVGDRCLRAIIEPIQAELRATDVVGRWGGEEFLVLLPGASAADARRVAERIRERIASLQVESEAGPVSFTTSVGVGCRVTGMYAPEDLVAAADRALYGAKRAGRNRVVVDEDLRSNQYRTEGG